MKVTLSALADYASLTEDGKLNVLGIFDVIGARQFPARLPLLVFVFRLRGEWADGGNEQRLTILLEDEDGAKAFTIDATVVPPRVEPGMYSHLNQIVNFGGVVFRKAGQYRVRLLVNGVETMDHPFTLSHDDEQ